MKISVALQSVDIRIKALALLFLLRLSAYLKPKPTLLGASLSVVNNFI
jgi:hypothetical protein